MVAARILGYGKEYSFTDAGVQTGSYYYRLKQVDFNGAFEYSNEIFAEIDKAETDNIYLITWLSTFEKMKKFIEGGQN